MVSPFVLILILVSVSIPVPILVQDGSSERGGTVQGLALRAVGFYRGRHSYIDDVWGRYAALEAGWRGVLAGANMEWWGAALRL